MLPMLLNVVFDPACTEGGNTAALPAGFTRYASSHSHACITVMRGRTCLLELTVYVSEPDACLVSCRRAMQVKSLWLKALHGQKASTSAVFFSKL